MEPGEQERMRRQPQQERARQRVAQILDAAEALFSEGGYEAATTNQIAARAGVPIGSLYQFFPNKDAILHAVAARYREAAIAALDGALTPEAAALPADALAALILQTMVDFGTSRIGLTKIVLQANANEALAVASAGIMQDASARLAAVLALRTPALGAARHRYAVRAALTAVMALLGVITAEKSLGEAHAKAILVETYVLLAAYIGALDAGRNAVWLANDGTIDQVS